MLQDVCNFDFLAFNKMRDMNSKSCYQDKKQRKKLAERDVGVFIGNLEFIVGNSSWKNLYEDQSKLQ